MKFRFLLLVSSFVALVTASHAAESVTVRLKWFHQAQFAGFYVAEQKGFYRDAGLDVAIQPGGPDFPAIQMVAGGNEQFGVAGADQVLVARSKGVPVVAVAVFFRKSPFVLFALKSSGIDRPAAFPGRHIGVKIGGNEELVYRAILKKAGLGSQAMNETPVKFDLTPLLTGQIDVWPGYVINEVIAAREKGFPVNVIWPSDFGIEMYADTLFTTEKMIREKPEVVKKFVAATLRGWTDATAHPEEAARLTVPYGDKLSFAHELAMMKESIPLLKPDAAPIGSMRPEVWSAMQALLIEGGFMKQPIDLDAAYTAKFIGP